MIVEIGHIFLIGAFVVSFIAGFSPLLRFLTKDNFYKVKLEIEKKIKEFISVGIEWLPINKISLDEEKTKSVINFLETLENDDDVQYVYANLEIDNNFAEKIST